MTKTVSGRALNSTHSTIYQYLTDVVHELKNIADRLSLSIHRTTKVVSVCNNQ